MGIRLNKVLKQLNVSTETVVEYLKSKPGLEPVKEMNPNTKVTDEQYAALLREFHGDKLIKERADSIFPVTSKEHKPLQGRDVIVIPDRDAIAEWSTVIGKMTDLANFTIFDICLKHAPEGNLKFDIADYIQQQHANPIRL